MNFYYRLSLIIHLQQKILTLILNAYESQHPLKFNSNIIDIKVVLALVIIIQMKLIIIINNIITELRSLKASFRSSNSLVQSLYAVVPRRSSSFGLDLSHLFSFCCLIFTLLFSGLDCPLHSLPLDSF